LYETHFGLVGRPFGETVNPSAYLALPSRDAVLRRLRYGLERGQGPALLFGPPGTGKTLLARALARDLGCPAAHLTFPAMPAPELLAFLAAELGAATGGTSTMSELLRALRAWLAAAAARGERPLLVVDEAHLIDDLATFETLRLLLNFATTGPPDLSLLLAGCPEVLLRLPAGFADRLSARCLLGPLSESESASYVVGRLAACGATSSLFGPEALAALHRAADGIPRRLNRLADLALLIAYAEGLPSPEPRTIAIAAREFDPDGLAA
jgi:type II secretory pathway predicted ATPase ExeA